MQDGKPIMPPMGRRAPTVNKIEFNELVERLEIAEAKIAKLEAEKDVPWSVAIVGESTQPCVDFSNDDGDKPRRGRKPKEATE